MRDKDSDAICRRLRLINAAIKDRDIAKSAPRGAMAGDSGVSGRTIF